MKKKNKNIQKIIPYMILLLIAGAFLLPLLWLVFAAFNPEASQAFAVPKHMSVENFRIILTDAKNQRGFLNSLFISVVQTGIVLVCSLLAAYPLSRYELKTRLSRFSNSVVRPP